MVLKQDQMCQRIDFHDGPAPIVEDIYDKNYAVDRGNGAIPIDFYINKWGVPDGFGKTEYEIQYC